ncbi:MAG TPA: DUF4232 domain-containing protein [Streptosporangiaceae bacterium]|nr:DUF4232 domain-containing protein [Streptosporangiaceae bacterium]
MTPPADGGRRGTAARRLAPGVAGLAIALLVAACSTSGQHGTASGSGSRLTLSPSPHIRQYLPHTSPAAVPTPARRPASSAPAPAPSTGPSGPATEPAAAGPAACPASGLKITIGSPSGAAGSLYYTLDFTNISGVTCTMYGYPGVSFATGPGGRVIGLPAVRDSAFAPSLVTVSPGRTAHASLQVQVAQSYPAPLCKPVTAHWLQIYPPASYVAGYVGLTAVTCRGHIQSGSTLGIYVIRPGATGP